MNTYISLFRGINIGGHHLIPMKGLVGLLEGLGCTKVMTYIQSGNVVFQSGEGNRDTLVREISDSIAENFGFRPVVLLLTAADLQDAIAHNPYDTHEGKALHLFFMATPPQAPDLERLDSLKTASEAFTLIGRIFYLYTPDGVGRSKLAARVEHCLGVPATARNWNTLGKIVAMLDELEQ
jgi:uncharacterized protein (DUF1697 family)